MGKIPVRLRVTLVFAGAMALLLAALGVFIYARYESQLNETIDQGLGSRADEVRAIFAGSGSGLADPGDRLVEADESFAQVISASGEVLDGTAQVGDAPVLDPDRLRTALSEPVYFDAAAPPGIEGEARVVATPATGAGEGPVIVVGTTLEDRDEALGTLAALLLAGGPVALLLASIAGYLSIGAALRPVEAMRRRADAISAAEPDERLPVPEADDEIRRLGLTLNEMLARLETALERERSFVNDASHELRTPLALLKTELELALRYGEGDGDLRAAVLSAREEVDRLVLLAEDLLVVARSERGRLPITLAPIDSGRLLDDVRERFDVRLADDSRRLSVDPGAKVSFEGDELRLEQALTNLIDNAIRHAAGDITLGAEREPGFVELHVRDQGAGFPPEFLPLAFERFSRADAGRTGGGSGLGLAIVAAIAASHGGSAGAANVPGGGADVWISIPVEGSSGQVR